MMWIVFGLIAAIFISSLHKILPSGRQLRLHRLREHARKLGFVVERQQGGDPDPALQGCIAYRMALERCPEQEEFSYRRGEAGWTRRFGATASDGLERLFAELPDSVVGLVRTRYFVVVYWVEPEEIETLDRLYQALQPLYQSPVG